MSVLTLAGRVAVVTGAAQGIGYHTAKMMCRNGMQVALVDLSQEKLDRAAQELRASPDAAETAPFACDVSDEQAIEKTVKQIVQRFGGIDVLVNGAGILSATKIPDIQRSEWDKILSVNLSGSFFMVQKTLPYLQQSKHGRIINISSVAGRMGGVENSMSYAASKGGLCAITRGMARHLAPFGITANAVCPGPTRTPIMDAYTDEKMRNLAAKNLLGRIGEPEDIAAGVCYLASEEAGYVTGIMLDINGGFWMG
ncbi:MAG: SDR family oxidoreductase [Spirochaetaceae bacterium]|jgi:3-oxoacyl-[acyl-carrier protein] reductase|nr:SDR family oxidoreductase [Spirochaetaceae bacterium]